MTRASASLHLTTAWGWNQGNHGNQGRNDLEGNHIRRLAECLGRKTQLRCHLIKGECFGKDAEINFEIGEDLYSIDIMTLYTVESSGAASLCLPTQAKCGQSQFNQLFEFLIWQDLEESTHHQKSTPVMSMLARNRAQPCGIFDSKLRSKTNRWCLWCFLPLSRPGGKDIFAHTQQFNGDGESLRGGERVLYVAWRFRWATCWGFVSTATGTLREAKPWSHGINSSCCSWIFCIKLQDEGRGCNQEVWLWLCQFVEYINRCPGFSQPRFPLVFPMTWPALSSDLAEESEWDEAKQKNRATTWSLDVSSNPILRSGTIKVYFSDKAQQSRMDTDIQPRLSHVLTCFSPNYITSHKYRVR